MLDVVAQPLVMGIGEAISGYERGGRGRHTIYVQSIMVKSYGSKARLFSSFILRVELEDSGSISPNIVSLSLLT